MWQDRLNGDSLSWLLERDKQNPGPLFFALRDLLERQAGDSDLDQARRAIMQRGPVPAILDAQYAEGYWVKPGGGYSPKYRGTTWQIKFLAELGADPGDERVRRGCEYVLDHSIAPNGAFSLLQKPVNSGVVPCLNGNLLYAMQELGFGQDERVRRALEWQARAVLGEDIDYLKSGTSGPLFACSANEGHSCGWGANKVLRGLLAAGEKQRSPLIDRAIEAGAAFLLSRDPAAADYPYTQRVSSTWFKLGFPLSYWSDILETAAVLVDAGHGGDPRLTGVIELILEKQDDQGRWALKNSLNGKMWADIEKKGKPSKWVTLRVLRMLKKQSNCQ
ncbi:MAG: nitrogen fixation protein NifH [Chloroflexota bacterium]|nr:nitrogen fixation protein NifH [Chloroflexota bacterium]